MANLVYGEKTVKASAGLGEDFIVPEWLFNNFRLFVRFSEKFPNVYVKGMYKVQGTFIPYYEIESLFIMPKDMHPFKIKATKGVHQLTAYKRIPGHLQNDIDNRLEVYIDEKDIDGIECDLISNMQEFHDAVVKLQGIKSLYTNPMEVLSVASGIPIESFESFPRDVLDKAIEIYLEEEQNGEPGVRYALCDATFELYPELGGDVKQMDAFISTTLETYSYEGMYLSRLQEHLNKDEGELVASEGTMENYEYVYSITQSVLDNCNPKVLKGFKELELKKYLINLSKQKQNRDYKLDIQILEVLTFEDISALTHEEHLELAETLYAMVEEVGLAEAPEPVKEPEKEPAPLIPEITEEVVTMHAPASDILEESNILDLYNYVSVDSIIDNPSVSNMEGELAKILLDIYNVYKVTGATIDKLIAPLIPSDLTHEELMQVPLVDRAHYLDMKLYNDFVNKYPADSEILKGKASIISAFANAHAGYTHGEDIVEAVKRGLSYNV